jgi:CRISPR system Cascade subunit CasD
MTVLLLRLAGPMQAWGSSSRFAHRTTEVAPTKSGVIGMLAAARGIRRTEPLTELLGLSFGVRLDQPGSLVRDYQTARPPGKPHSLLSYRFYLSDAVFLAAVGGEESLLLGLHDALRRPHFPLYLGRRSCPPDGPVSLGVHDGDVRQVLHSRDSWLAADWHRKRQAKTVTLEIIRDAQPDDRLTETIMDEPLSFDPAHRRHAWRTVVREHLEGVDNAELGIADEHDPMILLGG